MPFEIQGVSICTAHELHNRCRHFGWIQRSQIPILYLSYFWSYFTCKPSWELWQRIWYSPVSNVQEKEKEEKHSAPLASAKAHGHWDGEKTHTRRRRSQMSTWTGLRVRRERSKRAKCSWPDTFRSLWQICKVAWENLKEKISFIGSIGLHAAVRVRGKVSVWGTGFFHVWFLLKQYYFYILQSLSKTISEE